MAPEVLERLCCRFRGMDAAYDGDAAEQMLGQLVHFVGVEDRARQRRQGDVRWQERREGPNGRQVVVVVMEQGDLRASEAQ